MELKKWNKYHFFGYILLCIAKSDNNIDEKELDSIKNCIAKLKDDSENYIDEILPLFLNHSHDLRVNFIKTKWKLFLETEEEVLHVLDEIEEMILIDGIIDKSEIKTYGTIRKAFEICDHE